MEYYDKLRQIETIDHECLFMIVSDKYKATFYQKVWVGPDIWDEPKVIDDDQYIEFMDMVTLLDPVERHKIFGPIEIPTMEITTRHDPGNLFIQENPRVRMIDGRHRFMVLKMLGARQIPVAMRQQSIDIGREFGLL